MQPAVFLDRDGVINENRTDRVKRWSEVIFLAGVFDAMKQLAELRLLVVLVSNQSAVGRGMITLNTALELNDRIVGEVRARGGRIDAAYLCPHLPDHACKCRKPAPGMLTAAARDLDIDLKASFVVGDAITDMLAARSVGARGILVETGRGAQQAAHMRWQGDLTCPVVPDLSAAVAYILTRPEVGVGCNS